MPLLRKRSQPVAGERSRSPSKSATYGKPASKAGPAERRAPTPGAGGSHQPATTGGTAAAADDYVMPVREIVRPANQLVLTEDELEEEVGRCLTAGNSAAPTNLVRYSFKDRGYRAEAILDQQLCHFALGGCLMHCDSEEAARERRESHAAARSQQQSRRATGVPHGDAAAAAAQPKGDASLATAGGGMLGSEDQDDFSTRLRNQFNFADRAAQTGHYRPRERSTMTERPPTASSGGSCSRWEIYEAYIQDQERQRQAEELARQKAQVARKGNQQQAAALAQRTAELAMAPKEQAQRGASELAALPCRAARLVERMVQQNALKDVIMDFRYWDDPADGAVSEEGTLLPLWGEKGESFSSPRVKRRAVTALCWSPRYFDLFAVGYGSFDFLSPTTGLVCCYSLKSPGHPEFTCSTGAGVMCLDFHPEHPSLLAVGCYDGTLLIFDLREAGDRPIYQSTPGSGKHSDPVWQVCWQRTDSHELLLCSISTDGRVTQWSATKNELSHQDVMQLRSLRAREELIPPPLSAMEAAAASKMAAQASATGQQQQQQQQAAKQQHSGNGGGSQDESGEGTVGIAGGCCFDFNREQEFLFIVGSEDGSLYKCSTAHASEYLQAYCPGHHLPAYAVRWNSLHSRTFLSAGADWKVKLWDAALPKPVLSFDLRAPVGDVAWAPFSSTVFAAVTDAGKVHVFDLAQNRATAVCVQKVARKTRLTKLAFNTRHPMLLVGTEHGGVTCLKLSPNLRRSFSPDAVAASSGRTLRRTESELTAARTSEAARLEAVLALAAKCNQALREEDWQLM